MIILQWNSVKDYIRTHLKVMFLPLKSENAISVLSF